MEGIARYCQNCKAPCAGDFRKIVDLQYSGLVIYVHTRKDKQKKVGDLKYEDTFILHNIGSKQIKKPEYIGELHCFKTKCAQCKSIIESVRSLLDEIKTINENEVIGVCEHCKKAKSLSKKCRRCDFIVSEFKSMYEKTRERQQRFKVWLCKVIHLLQAIVNGDSVCQHRVYRDTELERIMQALKEPFGMREPKIDFFPNLDQEKLMSFQSMSENKETFEELLSEIEFVGERRDSSSENLHQSEEMCLCKYLTEKVEQGSFGLGLVSDASNILGVGLTKDQNKEMVHVSDNSLFDSETGIATKLVTKPRKSATKNSLQLQKQMSEKESKKDSSLDKEEVEGGNSGLSSRKTKDSGLTWERLNDFSKPLREEGHESLMKRLLDISKALSQELYLNKELKQEIIETIYAAIKQKLPKNIVLKLINELTKLKKTETRGLSKGLNRKITQELFNDLNDLLTMGSSKDLNHDLIKLLVDLSDLLTHELSKCLNKEQLRGQSKKEMLRKSSLDLTDALVQKLANLNRALVAGALDKNLVRKLVSDINKTIGQMPLDELIKILKEFTNLCKLAVHGIPKTANLKLVQGLIGDASKALGLGLSKDQNKKMVYVSVSNLNKALTSSTEKVQKPSIDFKKTISKDVSKVLRSKKTSFDVARNCKDIDKSLSDSETDVSIKATKPRKSETKNPSQLKPQTLEKQSKKGSSSDKTSRKVSGLERADKIGLGQYSSDDKDTKSFKKIVEKTMYGVSEKENLSPEYKKKRKFLKSQSNQKLSIPSVTDAKELSEILLHKKRVEAEKFKLNKQRQLAKLLEIERIRLKKWSTKNEKKMKNEIIPLPANRDEVSEVLIIGDTTLFDTKDIEEKPIDPEPLYSKTQLQSTDEPLARHNLQYQTLYKDRAVKYQLSNEEFIRKGWTVLPEEKIMRRMNIYRMEPANSYNCWFKRHQLDGELFYDSGQKLADIDHNGRGHWYYRNGTIALDYYNAQESNIGQRYVVYSSGTEMECGKIRPRTILALFDVLGHGVIYDLHGNLRLKYNQSEGVLVDPKIGPPGKWKWHTLNDPPVLQRVFINTCLKERDSKLEQVIKSTISKDTTEEARPAHPEMVAIELANFVKEKRFKLKQKFRPFQIRIKAVKLNEQFSLKILDQANIYLLYRDGVTRLKQNLGLLLKSDEIIDTVTSDVDVITPYDICPANTESVENIQKILKTVRSGKVHNLET